MEESFIIYQSKFGTIEVKYKDDKIILIKKYLKKNKSKYSKSSH
ncbi:hypothetical protein [Romboutsia sp. CE17]|nr:hypothetical protein [Romboutsia sp. CE17]